MTAAPKPGWWEVVRAMPRVVRQALGDRRRRRAWLSAYFRLHGYWSGWSRLYRFTAARLVAEVRRRADRALPFPCLPSMTRSDQLPRWSGRFVVLVDGTGATAAAIAATIAAVRRQSSELIAGCYVAGAVASGDGFAQVWPAFGLDPNTGWMVWIQAGAEPIDDAFVALARALAAVPDAQVAFADDERLVTTEWVDSVRLRPIWSSVLLLGGILPGPLVAWRGDLIPNERVKPDDYHDLLLRLDERRPKSVHVPLSLSRYAPATAPRLGSDRHAVEASLVRRGIAAHIETLAVADRWRVIPRPLGEPLISILIPTHDRSDLLAQCLEGILHRTDWPRLEVVIVDHASNEPETAAYLAQIVATHPDQVRVLRVEGPFNFSRLNNLAAAEARGEVLVLMNNDIEVLAGDWCRRMVGWLSFPGVGAVGAKLLYPNRTIQHLGVIIDDGARAVHVARHAPADAPGDPRLDVAGEWSAVTGACLMVRATDYREVGGLDERLAVTWNDIDFCVKLRQRGLTVVVDPGAVIIHHESISRGLDLSPEHLARNNDEFFIMRGKLPPTWRYDPFGHPRLKSGAEDLALATPDLPEGIEITRISETANFR